jgi:hypothetical protein
MFNNFAIIKIEHIFNYLTCQERKNHMNTLREHAIQAYQKDCELQQEAEETYWREQAEKARRIFDRIFCNEETQLSINPLLVSNNCLKAGDLLLYFHDGVYEQSWFTVHGECPDCHITADSRPIYTLAQLGKMIQNFEPDSSHHCMTEKEHAITPDSLGAELINLLKDIINYHNGGLL